MESNKRMRLMEGERGEERFLFLGSDYNLFCIDLKKTEEKYGAACSEFSYNPVVAEVAWTTHIHANSDFLPFCMSSTRFNFKAASFSSSSDSEIFLMGGEIQPHSSPFYSKYPSNEVYKLVPEISGNGDLKNIRIEVADSSVPRMKSGKACPIVEEIGGNLFVLHTRFVLGASDTLADIPFEMFDSQLGGWRTLPTPPFFAAHSGTVIYAHTVIEHRIVVETSRECFLFDTVKEEWRCCSDAVTGHLINRLPMTVPKSFPCFGVDDHGGPLYVGISLPLEPCAHLVRSDGSIFSTQILQGVIYDNILPPNYDDENEFLRKTVLIPLKSLQDNVVRLCACAIVSNNDMRCLALAVSIFSTKISLSSQQLIYKMISGELPDDYDHFAYSSFLDVIVERKYFFTVPLLDGFFNGPALLL